MATQDLSHELDDKDEIDKKIQELSSQIKREYKLRQIHHSNTKQKQKQKARKLKIQDQNSGVQCHHKKKILQTTHEFTRHTKTYQE